MMVAERAHCAPVQYLGIQLRNSALATATLYSRHGDERNLHRQPIHVIALDPEGTLADTDVLVKATAKTPLSGR